MSVSDILSFASKCFYEAHKATSAVKDTYDTIQTAKHNIESELKKIKALPNHKNQNEGE